MEPFGMPKWMLFALEFWMAVSYFNVLLDTLKVILETMFPGNYVAGISKAKSNYNQGITQQT